MYKVGDIVECVYNIPHIISKGKTYIVEPPLYDIFFSEWIYVKCDDGAFRSFQTKRFRNVTRKLKIEKILR